jgi:hypothetical protein
MSQIEVTARDDWDTVEVLRDPRINGPRSFHRHANMDNLVVGDDTLSFSVKEYEFEPWTEAIAELRSLMDSWRAKGWAQQADEIEHPRCGDDDCDCVHERSIYDEMGIGVEKWVPLAVPLAECRFYKTPFESFFRSLFVDDSMPSGYAHIINLSVTGLPEPNGGTDANPDFAYSKESYPLDFIPEAPVGVLSQPQRPSWWPKDSGPDVRGVPGTRFGSVGEAMAADYRSTAKELREQAAADTWVCANHPPGSEITYPATTATCEVCLTPKKV